MSCVRLGLPCYRARTVLSCPDTRSGLGTLLCLDLKTLLAHGSTTPKTVLLSRFTAGQRRLEAQLVERVGGVLDLHQLLHRVERRAAAWRAGRGRRPEEVWREDECHVAQVHLVLLAAGRRLVDDVHDPPQRPARLGRERVAEGLAAGGRVAVGDGVEGRGAEEAAVGQGADELLDEVGGDLRRRVVPVELACRSGEVGLRVGIGVVM